MDYVQNHTQYSDPLFSLEFEAKVTFCCLHSILRKIWFWLVDSSLTRSDLRENQVLMSYGHQA